MVRSFGAHIRTNLTAYLALLVALAGTGTYAAAPPLATATVSTSTLTQPVDGTRLSYDDRLPPSTVTVAGSTNGVSGDTVTLLCDDGAKSRTLLGPDIAVASDGSFSASVPLSDFSAAPGPCFLRAVPSGFDPYGGGDTSSYYGRQVTVARVRQRFTFASGPNAGKPADFFVFQQGTAAGNQYFSIADCGLCVSKLFYPSLFMNSASLWDGTAEVFPVEGSTPDRSYLKVDGRSAIAPGYDLQWGDGTHSRSLPGLDPLAYSYKNGPGPNGVTIHETDHFDRCATVSEPSWPPPTKSSCPSFRRTGVRVDRVVVQGSGGTEVTIVDSWRSEDGRAHDLDLHYDELVEKQGPDDPSYAFPWVSPAYSTHSPGDIVRAPAAAPASWLVAGDSGAPDGSALYPQGALTFDPVPDAILFRGLGDPLLRYHRRVPAGGALVITQVFDMASTRAAVGAAASAARHRLALPPALSGVGLAPASFAASKGTRLKLTLSKPAAVAVAVDQKLKGRKVKGRCEPKAKKGKRCTFRVPRAKLSLIGAAGANTFAFRPTGLKSGSYIAIVTARDADGRLSKPVTLKFKIKKRRKGKHH